jgi:hypothetical protein
MRADAVDGIERQRGAPAGAFAQNIRRRKPG